MTPDGIAFPWLAVLLFTRAEIEIAGNRSPAGSTGAQAVPLGAYLSPPAGTLGPALTPGLTALQQEQPDLSCTVVDVTFDAFRAVAPQSGELPYLAHVRQVGTGDQEELSVPAPGWYSVVTGNRLPTGAADGVYIAHLVSLEGFADYLPDQPAPQGRTLVRLVSLASWSFTSGSDGGDFASLMGNLSAAPLTVPVTVTETDTASQLLATAIADGYTLLGYATRLGEQTAAWYRGPCQPALVPQPAARLPSRERGAAVRPGYRHLRPVLRGGLGDRPAAHAGQRAGVALAGRLGSPAPPRPRAAAAQAASAPHGPGRVPPPSAGPGHRAPPPAHRPAGGPRPAGPGDVAGGAGTPGDPTGLRGRQLPGLLDEEALHRIAAWRPLQPGLRPCLLPSRSDAAGRADPGAEHFRADPGA